MGVMVLLIRGLPLLHGLLLIVFIIRNEDLYLRLLGDTSRFDLKLRPVGIAGAVADLNIYR